MLFEGFGTVGMIFNQTRPLFVHLLAARRRQGRQIVVIALQIGMPVDLLFGAAFLDRLLGKAWRTVEQRRLLLAGRLNSLDPEYRVLVEFVMNQDVQLVPGQLQNLDGLLQLGRNDQLLLEFVLESDF